jgi:hypothetical protein
LESCKTHTCQSPALPDERRQLSKAIFEDPAASIDERLPKIV